MYSNIVACILLLSLRLRGLRLGWYEGAQGEGLHYVRQLHSARGLLLDGHDRLHSEYVTIHVVVPVITARP